MQSCLPVHSASKLSRCVTSTSMVRASDPTRCTPRRSDLCAAPARREAVTVFGDGGQTRDLINVRDVVRANLIASEHPDAAGKIFNICTGVETRLLDLLDVMHELIPNVPAARVCRTARR